MSDQFRTLLWVDLEATGLDIAADDIIEIAAILTRPDLEELGFFHRVITPSDTGYQRMLARDPVRRMHSANGLLADCRSSQAVSVGQAERDLMRWLRRRQVPPGPDGYSVCGSGVAAFDIPFLRARMPTLMRGATYYPGIDTGVLRRAFTSWNGHPLTGDNQAKTHRALNDVACHLAEARAFRRLLTVPSAHQPTAAPVAGGHVEFPLPDPGDVTGIEPLLSAIGVLQQVFTPTQAGLAAARAVNPLTTLHGSLWLNLVLLTCLEHTQGVPGPTVLDGLRTAYISQSAARGA